jgi:hypothetical protein
MPKTLAALPSSQYATLRELVSGQLLLFALLFAPPLARASAIDASAGATLLLSGCVDFHLTDWRTDGWRGDVRTGKARAGELRQGRHTNRRRVRRGAAVRSCGKAWKTEAMAVRGRRRRRRRRRLRCCRRGFLCRAGGGGSARRVVAARQAVQCPASALSPPCRVQGGKHDTAGTHHTLSPAGDRRAESAQGAMAVRPPSSPPQADLLVLARCRLLLRAPLHFHVDDRLLRDTPANCR